MTVHSAETMRFEFATATRIVFGAGTLREAGPAARALGRQALLVTGRTAARAESLRELLAVEEIGTVEFAVLWPEGFSADFNPVRLYDGDGNLLAQEGETVELTGSFAAESTSYRPHRCSVGSELWLAGRVDRGG